MGNNFDRLWAFIVYNSIATEDELRLVTEINGSSVDTLGDVIWARCGLRSVEQLEEEGFDTSEIEDVEW